MTDEELLTDAGHILKEIEEKGDPFGGTDWSLVQILRDYVKIKKDMMDAKSEEDD